MPEVDFVLDEDEFVFAAGFFAASAIVVCDCRALAKGIRTQVSISAHAALRRPLAGREPDRQRLPRPRAERAVGEGKLIDRQSSEKFLYAYLAVALFPGNKKPNGRWRCHHL